MAQENTGSKPNPSPNCSLSTLKAGLDAIIDLKEVESILYHFSMLTNMATALVDLKGKVRFTTGWQDICTEFHRKPLVSGCDCTDAKIPSKNLKAGEYTDYKCLNGLRYLITPLYIGRKHAGNIYAGQFFYEDDRIHETLCIDSATTLEFAQDTCLDAVKRIPRFNRKNITDSLNFLVKLTTYISKTAYSNQQLEQEIIDRKRTEESLRLNELLFKEMGKMAQIGGWEFNAETKEGTWTEGVARIHDLDPEDETNVALGVSFFHGENRIKIESALTEIIQNGTPFDMELEIISAKGVCKWVHTMGRPRMENGKVVQVYGSFQDVTERKRIESKIHKLNQALEERVRERTAQLEASNKELEAFAYSVSHDLRAPLRAIDGYSRILLEDYGPNLDEEGQRFCTVISNSAKEMGKLIDDLLAFSRIGRAALKPSLVNMTTLANSIFFELTTPDEQKRINFKVNPVPNAQVDPSLVRLIWMNLLSNAVKFSAHEKPAVIEVKANKDGHYITYSVHDNGVGFDMQYENKLFGVFQRLHSAREFPGTGVGLAIVQRIVHRHGGRVWAHGEVEKGAVFYFTLPAESRNGV